MMPIASSSSASVGEDPFGLNVSMEIRRQKGGYRERQIMEAIIANPAAGPGHNSAEARIRILVKLFNSIVPFGQGAPIQHVDMPMGSTVGDVMRRFGIPADRVFLVLVNGRDITPTLGGRVNETFEIDEGDVVALSGPVPYSWGYGACVV